MTDKDSMPDTIWVGRRTGRGGGGIAATINQQGPWQIAYTRALNKDINKRRAPISNKTVSSEARGKALDALNDVQKFISAIVATREYGQSQFEACNLIRRALTPAPKIEGGDLALRGLEEIREIYCNIEGFVAETAPEGYLQQEIKRMYDTAIEHIELVRAYPRQAGEGE